MRSPTSHQFLPAFVRSSPETWLIHPQVAYSTLLNELMMGLLVYQGVIRSHVYIFCYFLPCCFSGDVSGESCEVEENRLLKDLPSQMCADRDQLLSRHAALTSRVGAHVQTSHICPWVYGLPIPLEICWISNLSTDKHTWPPDGESLCIVDTDVYSITRTVAYVLLR